MVRISLLFPEEKGADLKLYSDYTELSAGIYFARRFFILVFADRFPVEIGEGVENGSVIVSGEPGAEPGSLKPDAFTL